MFDVSDTTTKFLLCLGRECSIMGWSDGHMELVIIGKEVEGDPMPTYDVTNGEGVDGEEDRSKYRALRYSIL